jgi:hypothetical protein
MGMNKRPNGEHLKAIGWGISVKHFAANTSFFGVYNTHNTHATARYAQLATVTRLQPAVGRPRGLAVLLLARLI